MTVSTDTINNQPNFSPAIKELQAAIAVDPADTITKITLASQLEQEGFINEAAEVYQDIIDTDEDGVFAASAQQALLALDVTVKPTAAVDSPPQTTAIAATPPTEYSPAIKELQDEVAANPTDMVAQISLASALETEGHGQEAAAIYQYIIDNDPDGVFSASAIKALETLQYHQQPAVTVEAIAPAAPQAKKAGTRVKLELEDFDDDEEGVSPILRRARNLPIAQKQFVGFLLSSVISLTGVVGAGIAITGISGRSQLKNQATSELAVNQIEYDIKIDQMGFGFRGQSDNTAVVAAASQYSQSQTISPALQAQVKAILENEISARNIEYATLVGIDRRILVSANANRQGEVFDPGGLVTEVLANPNQIKASAIVPWEELQAENPPSLNDMTEGEDSLVRYTVTPVTGANDAVVGVLISGDVVIKSKVAIPSTTVAAFDGGYSSVYQVNPDGSFTLSAAASQAVSDNPAATGTAIKTSANAIEELSLGDSELLSEAIAADGEVVTGIQTVGGVQYTLAAKSIRNFADEPVAVLVRGTPEDGLNALLRNSLLLQAGVGTVAVLLSAILAGLIGRTLSKPIQELQKTAAQFGEGNFDVRAVATSQDEIGRLAETFNVMAEQITASTEAIATQSSRNEAEAAFQRQERERLQEGVIRLLLQIEEARRGDLRIQADVDAGEVGSIADAFNATLRSLRLLVTQVQSSANQVHDSAIANTDMITKLSDEASLQERAIQSAEQSVQGIARSIQSVAKSAQVAAKIAKKSRLAAQQGQQTMDETVENIDTIRGSVADTSKKAKRLAESSQEISKIVSIISDISEKTNLLAFNASIEATRAGENGQGFRVVADEVRRLAEQVTSSAQEIEQLISGIQEETVQMMQMMEESTTQVVTGTELVRKTKTTLQNVARISEEIDKVLGSISKATVSQRDASSQVTKTMQSVAIVAKKTASESQLMSAQLKGMTEVAIALQESSARFKVD